MSTDGEADDAIVPDDKDWTWVLDRACPDCGFDAATFPAGEVSGLTLRVAGAWRSLLTDRPAEDLRRRPAADTWSPLEYGCHVRDVLRLYDERLVLMLTQDGPRYPNWDQDVTAVADRYGEQDPAEVAEDLASAAARLATRFSTVTGSQWERTGKRSDGAFFTVDSFARYFVHDPVHHLHDVNGLLGGGVAPVGN